jgi:hypothetical protein
LLIPFVSETKEFCTPMFWNSELNLFPMAPVASPYIADRAVDPSQDVELRIFTLVAQRLSFREVVSALWPVWDDLMNCCASIEKLFVIPLSPFRDVNRIEVLARTELEYLFMNLRAFYDQTQRLLRAIWRCLNPRSNVLPASIADVFKRSDIELETRYSLTGGLVQWYRNIEQHVLHVREIRIGIEHHGRDAGFLYVYPDGFAVRTDHSPWKDFDIWPEHLIRPGNLGPLLRFVAWCVAEAVTSLTELGRVLERLALPEHVIEGRIFLRHPVGDHLLRLPRYMDEPWIRDEYAVDDLVRDVPSPNDAS